MEGGCLCREVRYRIDTTTVFSATCECRSCRKASAAAIVPWIHLGTENFTFTAGKAVEFQSSPGVVRTFCGRCGTPLTYRKDDYGPMIDVTTCSLDDPNAFPPMIHTWASHRLDWLKLDDGVPSLPEGPTDA